jgi:hypothetical protein
MMTRLFQALSALALLAACSDDSEGPSASGCPMGTVPGQTLACECGDAGATGVASCKDDGTLG